MFLEENNDNDAQEVKEYFLQYVQWIQKYGIINNDPWCELFYNWNLDGQDNEHGMINNWLLMAADVFGYAYSYSADPHIIETGNSLFHTATHNPGWEGDVLTYGTSKEAVNHAVFGPIFLYFLNKKFKIFPEAVYFRGG